MNPRALGWLVIGIGVIIVVVGLLILTGGLSWFGKLPGDIRIEGQRFQVFVPITSMIVVSIALSLALYLARRLFGA